MCVCGREEVLLIVCIVSLCLCIRKRAGEKFGNVYEIALFEYHFGWKAVLCGVGGCMFVKCFNQDGRAPHASIICNVSCTSLDLLSISGTCCACRGMPGTWGWVTSISLTCGKYLR